MAKKPRGPIKLPDAHKLFIHAEAFRLTCELLRKEVMDGNECYRCAFLANDAFCCELFLKCLSAVRSNEHSREHKLDELFKVLPSQDQESVERNYQRLSAGDPEHAKAGDESPSKSNELRDFLADGADVFELIRYWYERPFPHRRGDFHHPIMAIRATILEIRPDWRLQSERWIKTQSTPLPNP